MDNRDSIITLQLGHYANFVGSHFWNTQEASFVYPDSNNGTNVRYIITNYALLKPHSFGMDPVCSFIYKY